MPGTSNNFLRAFNAGNRAFGRSCGQPFEVVNNGTPGNGVSGIYQAVSIDDLSAASALVPGGRAGEISHTLFINDKVMHQAQIKDGTILLIYNKRVRVKTIHHEGDDTHQVDCTDAAGLRL